VLLAVALCSLRLFRQNLSAEGSVTGIRRGQYDVVAIQQFRLQKAGCSKDIAGDVVGRDLHRNNVIARHEARRQIVLVTR